MAHVIHAYNLPFIRAYYRRKALSNRLRAVFFFDYLNASLDLASRAYFRKEF